jgi:hypothetical protein
MGDRFIDKLAEVHVVDVIKQYQVGNVRLYKNAGLTITQNSHATITETGGDLPLEKF